MPYLAQNKRICCVNDFSGSVCFVEPPSLLFLFLFMMRQVVAVAWVDLVDDGWWLESGVQQGYNKRGRGKMIWGVVCFF